MNHVIVLLIVSKVGLNEKEEVYQQIYSVKVVLERSRDQINKQKTGTYE